MHKASVTSAPQSDRSGQPLAAILDDDPAIRDSFAALLGACGWQVEAFPTTEAFRAWCAANAADAYVMDVKLSGGGDGLAVLEALRAAGDETPAIIITGHADPDILRRALRAGAHEVLEKPFPAAPLLSALQRCIASPVARERVAAPAAPLTARESAVLSGLSAGQSQRRLAASLGVAVRSVAADRVAILHKLGARSLYQAMRCQHDRVA